MATYRISQFAERAGMEPTALRFYEREGLLPAGRSESGYRLYDDDSIERLRFISSGKHLGLPLAEIRDLLQVWEDGLCTDVRDRLRPMLLARIGDAEQRGIELAEFTERLHGALAEIDGPPRHGRCDPGCGFLHSETRTPVPVEPGRRRPSAAPEPTPIACSLAGDDQADRIRQWRQLLSDGAMEPVAGGVRFHLAATLAGQVAELAAAEQRCCPFFDFTLHLTDGELRFEVRAPAEAAPLVAEVFGTTDHRPAG